MKIETENAKKDTENKVFFKITVTLYSKYRKI